MPCTSIILNPEVTLRFRGYGKQVPPTSKQTANPSRQLPRIAPSKTRCDIAAGQHCGVV